MFVGVLTYEDGEHWPQEGRRDQALLEALVARGVPREKVATVWDQEATVARITEVLRAHLEASEPGEFFFFYYAGHGDRDEHGNGTFWVYDGALPMSEVFRWVERSFRGEAAFVTADCCCSGSLALDAAMRAGRVACAALTSSLSTVSSTGNWTFTNCLVDGFEGRLAVDRDGDGVLRLDELAAYTEQRMANLEGQLSTFCATNGFPADFVLGRARPAADPRVGTVMEASWEDAWLRVEVLDVREGEVLVHWLGYGSDEDAWVREDEVRPWEPPRFEPGARVAVHDAEGDAWWPAEVLAHRRGMHLVRYDDYGPHWDEWVAHDRLRAA